MFGNFTNKITKFVLNKAREKKNQEFNTFVDEIILELQNVLIGEEVYSGLIEKITQEFKNYLKNNKSLVFSDNKQVLQNMIKEVIEKYLIENQDFEPKKNIVVLGDNGVGKTTFACKLAVLLAKKHNKNVEVINIDPYRKGTEEQITQNLKGQNIKSTRLQEVTKDSIKSLGEENYKIFDTGGFSNCTEDYLQTIKNSFSRESTSFVYVGSSLTGQSSFKTLEKINSYFSLDVIIITNCEGDARCGVFLSSCFLINKPIWFISQNEYIVGDEYNDSLDLFKKSSIVKRLVGLYDESGVQESINKISTGNQSLIDKFMSGSFDFYFLRDMIDGTMKGNFNSLFNSLGNMNSLDANQKKEMRKILLAIQSMTHKERTNLNLLSKDPTKWSRYIRIAKGTNLYPEEVAQILMKMNMMIKTLENFGKSDMDSLMQTTDINELKEKFTDAEFMKKYIPNAEELQSEFTQNNIKEQASFASASQFQPSKFTDNLANKGIAMNPTLGANNPFANTEALKALKNFSPEQIYNIIQSLPDSMIEQLPGMNGVKASAIKSISLDQIKELMKNI